MILSAKSSQLVSVMNVKPPSSTRLTIINPRNTDDWEPDVTVVGVDTGAGAATVDAFAAQLPDADIRRWSIVFSHDGAVYNGYIQDMESRFGRKRLALMLNA